MGKRPARHSEASVARPNWGTTGGHAYDSARPGGVSSGRRMRNSFSVTITFAGGTTVDQTWTASVPGGITFII
jgi:hypothetical protein